MDVLKRVLERLSPEEYEWVLNTTAQDIQQAVATERERCAQYIENWSKELWAKHLANAIRKGK